MVYHYLIRKIIKYSCENLMKGSHITPAQEAKRRFYTQDFLFLTSVQNRQNVNVLVPFSSSLQQTQSSSQ